LLAGVALGEISRRIGRVGGPLLAVGGLFLAASHILVTNEYYFRLVRNGASEVWTDAIYSLTDYLRSVKCPTLYINDLGLFDVLRMPSRGKLPLRVGSDPLSKPQPDDEDRRVVRERMAEPGAVFVGHTDAAEQFQGVNARVRELAAQSGYRRIMLTEIPDRNG